MVTITPCTISSPPLLRRVSQRYLDPMDHQGSSRDSEIYLSLDFPTPARPMHRVRQALPGPILNERLHARDVEVQKKERRMPFLIPVSAVPSRSTGKWIQRHSQLRLDSRPLSHLETQSSPKRGSHLERQLFCRMVLRSYVS